MLTVNDRKRFSVPQTMDKFDLVSVFDWLTPELRLKTCRVT